MLIIYVCMRLSCAPASHPIVRIYLSQHRQGGRVYGLTRITRKLRMREKKRIEFVPFLLARSLLHNSLRVHFQEDSFLLVVHGLGLRSIVSEIARLLLM
jgi:hypothetical protein